MRRREPHTIHFQEFENLEQDCKQSLGIGDIPTCIKHLDTYLKHHPNKNISGSLLSYQGRYNKNEKDYSNALISREHYNLERNRIQDILINFIDECQPPSYNEYQQTSLRRKSKWDERDNLTIFLQFDRDFRYLKDLFIEFETYWLPQIQTEKYYIDKNGDEIIFPDDYNEDHLPIGVASGETVKLPEDIEEKEMADISLLTETEPETHPKVISRSLLETGIALRIRKQYQKIVYEIDEYGKEGTVLIEETAYAIVEKSDTGVQILLSVMGANDAKCNLANEILQWFENHEHIANGRIEPFSICIPQAKYFTASQDSETELLISLKQPV